MEKSETEIDNESLSMYYSFNNSESADAADKTLEARTCFDFDNDANDSNENNCTLEGEKAEDSSIKTVKRNPSLSAALKNVVFSSTPTRYFSPRPISSFTKTNHIINNSSSQIPSGSIEKIIDLTEENKENCINTTTNNKLNNEIDGIVKISARGENKKRSSIDNGAKKTNDQQIINVVTEKRNAKINSIAEQSNDNQINTLIPSFDNARREKMKTSRFSTMPVQILSCVPDLSTNRPSRISKKFSPTPILKEKPAAAAATSTMTNDLNLQSNLKTSIKNEKQDDKLKINNLAAKRRTLHAAYTFPTIKNNKLDVDVKQGVIPKLMQLNNHIKRPSRISSIVKTTLNSPGMINNNKTKRKTAILFNPNDKFSRKNVTIRNLTMKNDNLPLIKPLDFPPSTSTTMTKKNIAIKSTPFICSICSREFRLQSLYENHLLSHREKQNVTENKCKFCDKKFAFRKALDIHLSHNCLKIPIKEKKKILTNNFQTLIQQQMKKMPPAGNNSDGGILSISNNNADKSSVDLIVNELKTTVVIDESTMPPPASNQIKKKIPYSGIYRTPTKLVSCQKCRQYFNNVLSYTEHMVEFHGEEDNY